MFFINSKEDNGGDGFCKVVCISALCTTGCWFFGCGEKTNIKSIFLREKIKCDKMQRKSSRIDT